MAAITYTEARFSPDNLLGMSPLTYGRAELAGIKTQSLSASWYSLSPIAYHSHQITRKGFFLVAVNFSGKSQYSFSFRFLVFLLGLITCFDLIGSYTVHLCTSFWPQL